MIVLRVIGIGLLILIGLPLAIAFAPLLLLAGGVWFLLRRWRLGKHAGMAMPAPHWSVIGRRVNTGWHPSELVNHTRLCPQGRVRREGRPLTSSSTLLTLIGVAVLLWILSAVVRQAPFLVAPVLVIGLGLALNAAGRRRARPDTPAVVPARGVSTLSVLSDREFEQRVAELLHASHFHGIQHISPPGRPGIDLIARDQHGHLFLVHCHHVAPGTRTGSAEVQRLLDAVRQEQAGGGILVTTGSFTQAAVNLAQYSRVPIILYDGQALTWHSTRPALAWPAA